MSQVTITIAAKTMEGTPVVDPNVTVTLSELQPFQRQLNVPVPMAFNSQVTVPVNADLGANPLWAVAPGFSRFYPPDPVQYRPSAEPNKAIELTLVRLISAWNARFVLYANLPSPRFDAFKAVVAVSKDVDLKYQAEPVGDLEAQYDMLDVLPKMLAKTALLNLYSVLTDELDPVVERQQVRWWSYVKEIVRIDQERFVALVEKDLFDHVKQIVAGLNGPFAGRGYTTEGELDFPLHYPNIPARFDCPANLSEPMVTVKIPYEQGDVQLTMTAYKTGEYLLDCDMDEHQNLLKHTVDLAEHAAEELANAAEAGTHPFLMHEYIVLDSAQQAGNDGVATVDMGYTLV